MNKRKTALLLSLMIASAPVSGLMSVTASASSQPAVVMTKTDAPAEVKEMKGEDLKKIIEDKKKKDTVLIIDVRKPEEYNAGHVMNAINIPLADTEARLSEIADFMDKPVVTYCNSGKQSAQSAKILTEYGFKDVSNAQGVKEFTYDLVTFPNIRGEALKKIVDEKKDVVILDIRPDKDTKEGIIDGALHIPLDQLKEKMAELPKDKEIYVYCNTGTKSVEAAQILKDAGYNVTNVIEGTKEFTYDLVKPQ